MAVNLLLVGVLFLELEIGLFTQMAAATYRYPKRKKRQRAPPERGMGRLPAICG